MMFLRKNRGTILIISLWIATILVAFCISIAYRANLGLRMTKLYRNRLKAGAICEGALFRIIQEKIEHDETDGVDYFAESWSNKMDEDAEEEGALYFQDVKLGEGVFTISYDYLESIDGYPRTFYGMQDEQSKFNLNKIEGREVQFKALLEQVKIGLDTESITLEIKKWMNDHDGRINSLGELEHIEGLNKEILYTYDADGDGVVNSYEIGILDYVTLYGDDDSKINVNTTSKEMLLALGFKDEHADFIIDERLGADLIFGTEDDGILSILNLRNALEAQFTPNIPAAEVYDLLSVKSLIYRARITAQVRNVKKTLEAVLDFSSSGQPKLLYWYEN